MTREEIIQITEQLKSKENMRSELSGLRQALRDDRKHQAETGALISEQMTNSLWEKCLTAEDAKTRKNAASLAADIESVSPGSTENQQEMIWNSYCSENTLFVRSFYLKAMTHETSWNHQKELRERLTVIENTDWSESDLPHIRAERRELERILSVEADQAKIHSWRGIQKPHDLILTAENYFIPELAREAELLLCDAAGVTAVPWGVRVKADPRIFGKIAELRTYQELLLAVPIRRGSVITPDTASDVIADSRILSLMDEVYRGSEAKHYTFRLAVRRMKRTVSSDNNGYHRKSDDSAWIRRVSYEIEEKTGHRLVNVPGRYECEIVLLEKKDGSYRLALAPSLREDRRFDYRRYSEPTSMAPYKAAQMVALVHPYLKPGAQVIDPLAGVGTLLIERTYAVPADEEKRGDIYALDTYGRAVREGRANAAAAGVKINYINRSFFDFHHDYLFDEILTECPQSGAMERDERDDFYRRFFDQAENLLVQEGLVVMLTAEDSLVRKQIRLHEHLRLEREIGMGHRRTIYIIVRR